MRAQPKANTRGLPTLPALASPLNGIVEIAPSERTLVPGDGPRIAETRFAYWLSCLTAQQQPAPSLRGA
jgi:hypothetical protein